MIPRLRGALLQLYGDYIHEIIIVNDNSTDDTGAVVARLAEVDPPRVKVVVREGEPGVGRALRDGYASATGRYVLSRDST